MHVHATAVVFDTGEIQGVYQSTCAEGVSEAPRICGNVYVCVYVCVRVCVCVCVCMCVCVNMCVFVYNMHITRVCVFAHVCV